MASDKRQAAMDAIEEILKSRMPAPTVPPGGGMGGQSDDIEIDPDLLQPSQKNAPDEGGQARVNDPDNVLDKVKQNKGDDEAPSQQNNKNSSNGQSNDKNKQDGQQGRDGDGESGEGSNKKDDNNQSGNEGSKGESGKNKSSDNNQQQGGEGNGEKAERGKDADEVTKIGKNSKDGEDENKPSSTKEPGEETTRPWRKEPKESTTSEHEQSKDYIDGWNDLMAAYNNHEFHSVEEIDELIRKVSKGDTTIL